MSNEGSLQAEASQFAFDLDSQKGMTILLASIRAAELSPEHKNELRDLIFTYSNGGRDESVKLTIEQKVAAYGLQMAPGLKTEVVPPTPEKPRPAFGTSRPAPSFTPSFAKPTPAVEPIIEVVKNSPPKIEVTITKPIESPKVVVQAPQPAPVSVSEIPAQPVVETAPEPIAAVTAAPQGEPMPVTVPEANTDTAETTPYDAAESLQRIKEIKAIVNDKVGNPVNLVDIDNEVGREYMGALLDAMKKINSGSSAISAMKRLEASFMEVQKTIERHNTSQDEVESPEVKTEVKPKIEETIVQAPQPAPVSVSEIPAQPVVETAPEPIAAVTAAPQSEPVPEVVEKINPVFQPVTEVNLSSLENQEANKPNPVTEVESAWGQDSSPVEVKPESRIPIAKIASLGESNTRPISIDNLPSAASLESSSVKGDALFTKQVDEGLAQLLQEWSIFKKSGLFGTGPKGVEHPLFKKIASLQIPLLLAGRFEGATQEIKQSITDYMNGWRYEQGIIYEQGETFEHYLRRVIRHILDLQKNK